MGDIAYPLLTAEPRNGHRLVVESNGASSGNSIDEEKLECANRPVRYARCLEPVTWILPLVILIGHRI